MCGTERYRSCHWQMWKCHQNMYQDKDWDAMRKHPYKFVDEGYRRYLKWWWVPNAYRRLCRIVASGYDYPTRADIDYYGYDMKKSMTKHCRLLCKSMGAVYFTFSTHRYECHCKSSYNGRPRKWPQAVITARKRLGWGLTLIY